MALKLQDFILKMSSLNYRRLIHYPEEFSGFTQSRQTNFDTPGRATITSFIALPRHKLTIQQNTTIVAGMGSL
jgi:hypothetical protein